MRGFGKRDIALSSVSVERPGAEGIPIVRTRSRCLLTSHSLSTRSLERY